MSKSSAKLSSAMSNLAEEFSIKYLNDWENSNFQVPALQINVNSLNIDITCEYIENSDADRLEIDLKVALNTQNSPNDYIKTVKL